MVARKIIAVDDEEHIRMLLYEELTDEGYNVITTGNCDNLLEMIAKENPDLVILDIKLGSNSHGKEIDGLDLLIKIRYKFYDLPVILLTAYPSFKGEARAFAADYYVEKSFNFGQLKDYVTRVFETRVLHEAKRTKEAKKERDAVWRGLSFAAAHKIGNPIFTLETDFQILKAKIKEMDGAKNLLQYVENMEPALEKSKTIIEQFKSFAKAEDLSACSVDIEPLLEDSCRVAKTRGVEVNIRINASQPQVMADANKIGECFDELVMNTLSWLDKPEKKITITVNEAPEKELPMELDELHKYIRIRFQDNGCGIPSHLKDEIFLPFFTTKQQGTGLGLAIVEQIIRGHDGLIQEVGNPTEGSVFEMYLPKSEKLA